MVVTYSHLRGFGYPGTRDSALHLAQGLGAFVPALDESRPMAKSWPELDGTSAFRVQEYTQQGDFHALGAWPEGSLGADGSAHVYHCSYVQPGVWRHFLAPRWRGCQQVDVPTCPMAAQGTILPACDSPA